MRRWSVHGLHWRRCDELQSPSPHQSMLRRYVRMVQSVARPIAPAGDVEGDGWVKIATAQAERTIAGDVWMPLVALKAVLATRGLTIAGPAERAVLDACAAMTEEGIDAAAGQSGSVDRALEDELARRAAKEGTNGQ